MSESQWTRAELLRQTAVAGIGLTVAGKAGLDVFGDAALAAPAATSRPVHAYLSRPDLRPPIVTVRTYKQGLTAKGLVFMAPLSGPGARGTMLIDNTGAPVYFHATKPVTGLNFRAAMYRGKPVLTWWEGKTQNGLGVGTHVVLDDTYRVVRRFPAANGLNSDLHEFLITDRNTALISAWEYTEADLTAFGGKRNGLVVNGVVQELELPSGRVLFEWKSLDHVPLDESYVGVGPSFDYFHINSIERDADGNYLVSARNTWAIYKIDGETGKVIWRLNGKRSDFKMGPGTVFAYQHDARMHAGHLLSLYDDGGAPKVQPQSKALVLHLDTKQMRATLHRRYVHYPPAVSRATGNTQILPNGNVFVGWGLAPFFSEHTEDGRVVFDATLPKGGQHYRTVRFPWKGTPYFPPALAATPHGGGHLLHASWNGATELAQWQLETGPSAGQLRTDRSVPRKSFETRIDVPAGNKYARVAALDADGKVLRHSKTLKLT